MGEPIKPAVIESLKDLARKGALALSELRGAAFWWIAVQGLGFASVLLVSRMIGPEGYGRLGLAMTLGTYACYVNQWGIDLLLTRMLARDGAQNSRGHLAAFVRQKQISGIILLGIAIVCIRYWPVENERALIFLGMLAGLTLSFTVPSAFDVQRRTGTYIAITATRQFFYLLLIGLFWAWMRPGVSAHSILLAETLSILLQIALEWIWVRRTYGALRWDSANSEAKDLWRSAIPTATAFASIQALMLAGAPLLEALGHREQMGALIASNQLATVAVSLAGLVIRTVHARLTEFPDAFGDAFRRRVWLLTLGMTALGVAIALSLTALSDIAIALVFGGKFGAAAPVFAIDIWRSVGMLSGAVLGSALICQNRVKAFAACHVLAMIVGLAIMMVYVPAHGAIAAVSAVGIGRAAFAVFAAVVFCVPAAKKAAK